MGERAGLRREVARSVSGTEEASNKGLFYDSNNSNRSYYSLRAWTLYAMYWTECSA